MAQHDMNIANQGFPGFRADLNDALAALVSNSSGATAPATTFAHQLWVDTAADPSILKIRNADNDAFITIGEIDQTGDKFNLKCANATILENLTVNAQGDVRFADSDSSHYVAFQAPATVTSNVTFTLPSADGTTGQALVTNGSGTLSFATAGGGKVLQVIQALKTDTQSTSSTTYVDVTGLSVTITPTSASSKILVMIRINAIANDAAAGTYFNILRGATSIVSSTAGGQADTENAWGIGGGGGMTFNDRKISSAVLDYLDSPNTTSATTYKIQFLVTSNAGYVNSWATNNDLAAVSSITVMEIAA